MDLSLDLDVERLVFLLCQDIPRTTWTSMYSMSVWYYVESYWRTSQQGSRQKRCDGLDRGGLSRVNVGLTEPVTFDERRTGQETMHEMR
jgi:hypothetical protein